MAELILKFFQDEVGELHVPVETAICLSVIDYTESKLNVTLLKDCCDKSTYRVKYMSSGNTHVRTEQINFKPLYTELPAVVLDDSMSYMAGLAAVLRQIVKSSNKKGLLGFRNCCLAAPAETSSWTRFCEVDIVYCLQKIFSSQDNCHTSEKNINLDCGDVSDFCFLPEELLTLEYHLSIPAKVHNRGRYGEGGPKHDYVEGPHMVVSDLVIAICAHLILDYLGANDSASIPYTQKWLSRILIQDGFSEVLSQFSNIYHFKIKTTAWLLPKLNDEPVNLYKKEGTRRKRIFTQGDLLASSLDVIKEVPLMEYKYIFKESDLESIAIVLPDVPKDRLERKIQQLTNLARAALQVAKEGDIIVDMCCGSGHLGLLLASLLPSCTIILLDNKEKSLERALLRVKEMELNNVKVVQSNLDYFTGTFQIGVSLHACGVASDLVIKKCLHSNAHLILCPCCYGGIRSNHVVRYPQSAEFQRTGLREHDFFVLAHNADTCDTEDGHIAMTAVDSDRCLFLTENGYKVTLSKLQPSDCTTRNNMIVAVHS